MNFKFSFLFISAAMMVFFCGCGVKSSNDQIKSDKESKVRTELPYDTSLTAVAQIVAGIRPSDTTGLNAVVQTAAWKNHATGLDSLFSAAERKNLKAMRQWAVSELQEGKDTSATLFYAFSGPDYLYANTFYPAAKRYVLFGLEPVGKIPVFDATKNHQLFFDNIRRSLKSSLALNFFITKDMSGDLRSSEYNGVTSIIMLYAAYTGHKIKDIQYVYADATGKLSKCSYDSLRLHKETKGVQFNLIDSLGRNKEVVYFSFNAMDGEIEKTTIFPFFKSLSGNIFGMLKAASYLMHYESFSKMRDMFLSKVTTLLSDDTGLAWKMFTKTFPKHQLYGVYSEPVSMFSYISLRDLKAAYDSVPVKPMSFHYGYGTGQKVMIGRK